MISFLARWEPEALAKRLAQMFEGEEHAEPSPNGEKWHIGRKNEFWLRHNGGESFLLTYRYPSTEKDHAIRTMLKWCINARIPL